MSRTISHGILQIRKTYCDKNGALKKATPGILLVEVVSVIKKDGPVVTGNRQLSVPQFLFDPAKRT